MKNPIIIEFLDRKDKVTSTEMYLSVEDLLIKIKIEMLMLLCIRLKR